MSSTVTPAAHASGPTEAKAALSATAAAFTVVGLVVLLIGLAGLAALIGAWAWLVCVASAVLIGGISRTEVQHRILVLALIPATLLTNSALVPAAGRYMPAVTVVGALAVANRTDLATIRERARAIPKWLRLLLVLYATWMLVTTITSTEREVSLAYAVGGIVILGVTFLLIPFTPDRSRLLHDLAATLVLVGVAIIVSGFLLALAGGIEIYGKSVGLYFIDEATLFGHPTGVVFLQNYGPFVGPETTPLALGVAAALYLRSASLGRTRLAWSVALVVLLIGLLSTFSREGWLIAVVACLALALRGHTSAPMVRSAVITGVALLVIFVAGITNAVGVLGRMDLTTSWYGAHAASVLLNPNPTQRGNSSGTPTTTPTTSAPAAPTVERTLASPCVAPPAGSGSSSGSSSTPPTAQTVELKGFSSLLARLCLWEAAARAIIHSPIFGYGLGTDADAIIPFFYGQDAGVRGATTHNTFLRIGVEMGVPGLAIYVAITLIAAWMALVTIRRGGSGAEAILAASILGITVAELSDTLLFGGLSFPGFWLAMSVALLAVKRSDGIQLPVGMVS